MDKQFRKAKSLNEIIELCKRRGFIFHSSEIYGGMQGIYDYGPLGVELKNNLKQSWWKEIVHKRDDVEGLDSAILTHCLTLRYSQHESTFSDPMVDCKKCKSRFRADKVTDNKCIDCGSQELSDIRQFNLMFKCAFGALEEKGNYAYLRPETAQSIFINFKNILDSTSRKIPFGIAQIGKAFRNEITARNFIFRTREFEQMEIEFFVEKGDDEKWHQHWIEERLSWWKEQGLSEENLRLFKQPKEELSHYAKATVDILYKFPHGFDEIEGIANRADFDLGSHSRENHNLNLDSKVMENVDSTIILSTKNNQGENIIPFVIEPSAGVDRGILAILVEAYTRETLNDGNERIVLKLKPHLAPYKLAIIPLARNNEKIVNKAKALTNAIKKMGIGRIKYEDSGNIGKSYRRHDEIGTPYCITVDFQTFEDEDETVTVRERDSMLQKRIPIEKLLHNLKRSSTILDFDCFEILEL